MKQKEHELKSTLTAQGFGEVENHEQLLKEAMTHARSFIKITEGIAVLSDFSHHNCHTFSGKFGKYAFKLPEYSMDEKSPFEDNIFNDVQKEYLLERHILELRFFHFIKSLSVSQKADYQMSCIIRLLRPDGSLLPVLHSSRYIQCRKDGSVWLGLCTYLPLPVAGLRTESSIFNIMTGEMVEMEQYAKHDNQLLSKRQTEILALLTKGNGSKQIADELSISIHTVNRHRQDILSALKVTNTTAAVEIALRLHLI